MAKKKQELRLIKFIQTRTINKFNIFKESQEGINILPGFHYNTTNTKTGVYDKLKT